MQMTPALSQRPEPSEANPHFEGDTDLVSSQPWVWLPWTVVKKDRRRAIAIWVTLLAAFLAYIAYIIWATVESRANPASSVEKKQQPFKFPDMAFCVSFKEGCLTEENCFSSLEGHWSVINSYGFLDDSDALTGDDRSLAVEETYPGCEVIPFSRLEVNQTGVENGDINFFAASLFFLWEEDPNGDYNITKDNINTQFVKVFFIDIDKDVDAIGKEIVDAKLPYDRIQLTTDEVFNVTENHMVLRMEEFVGISTGSGAKLVPERTYFQGITSGKQNWLWTNDSSDSLYSFLSLEIAIDKFEYTRFVEVDPVDGWTIIGSIGGVWQFVVLGFGMFFVYAEKQRPDMKMRNLRKTILKPASVITHRLSSVSSKLSDQTNIHKSDDQGDERLPPGWTVWIDDQGQTYYLNTILKTTQWQRPTQCAPTNHRMGVQAVDTPVARSRERFASSFSDVHESKHQEHVHDIENPIGTFLSAGTATPAGSRFLASADDTSLPQNSEERVAQHGKKYYANSLTRKIKCKPPHI